MRAKRLEYYRDLVVILLSKDLKRRYKGTYLGYLWSILNPLAFAMVYFFVFKIVMRFDMEDYALFLICGMFPWQWFCDSAMSGCGAFIQNAPMIKKVVFPRYILVLVAVMSDMVHFLVSIPVIMLFMLYYGVSISWWWIVQIPLLTLLMFALSFGVALFLATLNPFFRDIQPLVGIATRLGLFLTPIFYPIERIPEDMSWILYINPMAGLAICWRSVFMEGTLPILYLGLSVVHSCLALIIGYWVYRRLEWRFAEIV